MLQLPLLCPSKASHTLHGVIGGASPLRSRNTLFRSWPPRRLCAALSRVCRPPLPAPHQAPTAPAPAPAPSPGPGPGPGPQPYPSVPLAASPPAAPAPARPRPRPRRRGTMTTTTTTNHRLRRGKKGVQNRCKSERGGMRPMRCVRNAARTAGLVGRVVRRGVVAPFRAVLAALPLGPRVVVAAVAVAAAARARRRADGASTAFTTG